MKAAHHVGKGDPFGKMLVDIRRDVIRLRRVADRDHVHKQGVFHTRLGDRGGGAHMVAAAMRKRVIGLAHLAFGDAEILYALPDLVKGAEIVGKLTEGDKAEQAFAVIERNGGVGDARVAGVRGGTVIDDALGKQREIRACTALPSFSGASNSVAERILLWRLDDEEIHPVVPEAERQPRDRCDVVQKRVYFLDIIIDLHASILQRLAQIVNKLFATSGK